MHPHGLVTLLLTFLLSLSAYSLPTGVFPASFSNTVVKSTPLESNRVTLPLARRVNATGGSSKVLTFDQARAQALRQRAQANPKHLSSGRPSLFDDPVINQMVCYVTPVLIGEPPQIYNLLIDTGSSNTWIGAAKPYVPTSSAMATGDFVHVEYGSGKFSGAEWIDKVVLDDNLTIPNQSIGVAFLSQGFDGVDGILGIGPQALTRGSLELQPDAIVPTVTDNAMALGLLDNYVLGISFHPYDESSPTNGELTFGGVDNTKFRPLLHTVPITTTTPANHYVGIDQTITYGRARNQRGRETADNDETLVMGFTAGILDTGTTLVLLPSDAFQVYQNVTGSVQDENTGLLRISPEQFSKLKTLKFWVGGVAYELSPDAQIWPRVLNTVIDGDPDGIYLIVNDVGSPSGHGLDFINGMAFLERFYMVYNVGDNSVSLAETPYTYARSNYELGKDARTDSDDSSSDNDEYPTTLFSFPPTLQ